MNNTATQALSPKQKVDMARVLAIMAPKDLDFIYIDGMNPNEHPVCKIAKDLTLAAFKQPPDEPEYLGYLGFELIRFGEYEKAIECYKLHLSKKPDDGLAWNNIAWCLLRLGKPVEALEPCKRALAKVPEHSHFHHDHAAILLALGEVNQAIAVAEGAARDLKPEAPQLLYLVAVAYEQAKESESAVRAWKRYLQSLHSVSGHHRAAQRAVDALKRHGVADAETLAGKALETPAAGMEFVRGATEEIMNSFGLGPLTFDAPSNLEASLDRKAERLALRGVRLLQRARCFKIARAEAKCRKALRTWPYCAMARVLHARLALQKKDYEGYSRYVMLANIEQGVMPDSQVRARALFGFVYYMILVNTEKMYHDGNYASALDQVNELQTPLDRSPEAAFLRGLILAELGRLGEAEKCLDSLRDDDGFHGPGRKNVRPAVKTLARVIEHRKRVERNAALAALSRSTSRESATASSPATMSSYRRW